MGRSSLKSCSDSRDEKPIQILSPFNPNFLLISELIGNERNFDMATVLLLDLREEDGGKGTMREIHWLVQEISSESSSKKGV